MKLKKDKIAGIIQKEISEIIQFELKDPKIGFITITDVEVSADLSQAKIYVSFLGQNARKEAGMKALERSKGFLRTQLAAKLSIRKVPQLVFLQDNALEQGYKIEKIIADIHKNESQ
ncbi:MAG: 30S ribosome-binding factor RbfA [Erysipelotrichaceae bacterium]|nr:30S ribosome-binding factor RbfA [Erysipelotrichaceae bacterium]MCI9523432.1 30S ribosome-binding factor RbfA [Erysipelotrichaceae bacterium]